MRTDPHVRLFDIAALPYDLFFHSQRRAFRRAFARYGVRLALPSAARILDIGCGTGSLASVLSDRGYRVHAVEPSTLMRARAHRRLRDTGVALSRGNVLEGLAFPDHAFDLVVASHVAHGFSPSSRTVLYREALRVSKGLVLFSDFPPRALRHGGSGLYMLETLERSDYRRFVRTGAEGMRRIFSSVEVVPVDLGSAWYVCRGRRGGRG